MVDRPFVDRGVWVGRLFEDLVAEEVVAGEAGVALAASAYRIRRVARRPGGPYRLLASDRWEAEWGSTSTAGTGP